ncbi:MAG: pilus (MSHA type) biogenesis protein MshL [Nitrospirota bacterium]|jgi:MSHA biogenesis protein MshL
MTYLEAIRLTFVSLAAGVALAACAHSPPAPAAASARPTSAPPHIEPQELQVIDVVEVEPQPGPERFTLTVSDADIADVLMVLAKDASFSVTLAPGVSGQVTADLKAVTLTEALDALLEPLGYAYSIDGERVHVFAPGAVTRTFYLDYLNARRGGNTTLTISAGAGEGAGVGGRASSTISRSVDVDLWDEVAAGLQMVITMGGNGTPAQVVINRQAGTILVTADGALMRRVEAYVDEIRRAIGRQVMIEAKIVEVQLSDGFKMGVDWAAIPGLAGGLTGNLTGGIADSLSLRPSLGQDLGGSNTALRFGATSHDLTFLLDAIATQGQVRVLSSPRIAALNNQPAVIKVAQEQTFFSTERQTNIEGGVTQDNFSVDKEKFTIGIVLDILPRIASDGTVVMNVHPSITEFVSEKVFPPDATGDEVLANSPILDVREMDTVVRVRDGETLVIAGLMREEDHEQLRAVPVLGAIPFLGTMFRNTDQLRRTSELVIFLTPHVVDEAADIAMASPLIDRHPTYHLGGKATRLGVDAETELQGWR